MKKVFVDTNVWLRFFLKDDKDKFEKVYKFVASIEKGAFRAYTSSIVFLEISYVLKNLYKFSISEILKIIESIKEVRNITVLEKTDSEKAIEYYSKYHVKFTDCLIASQILSKMAIVTYDEEFNKIKEIISKKPEDL